MTQFQMFISSIYFVIRSILVIGIESTDMCMYFMLTVTRFTVEITEVCFSMMILYRNFEIIAYYLFVNKCVILYIVQSVCFLSPNCRIHSLILTLALLIIISV